MLDANNDRTLDQYVIKTLLYYDIFNYPLKCREVFQFLGVNSVTEKDVIHSLNALTEEQFLFRFKDLYSLQPHEANVQRRLKGNAEAEKYLVLANKKAKLISRFPFVRAVFASGSLSKGYMDENSDLDFFIITQPKRLWIARTLLVMYKRFFLFNSHKYFCVNYFVDEEHLEIEEKNLFTATELATVMPLYGATYYENLHQANTWLKDFFPNYNRRSVADVPDSISSQGKRILEKIINIFFGNTLEKFFQHRTLSRWKNQYGKNYSTADFKVAFKSTSYASKNHPRNFQRKIMEVYAERLLSFGLNSESASSQSNAKAYFLKEEVLTNSNANA